MEEEDAAEAEAPEEFFDPIMSEIMSDPVNLPSGNVMDRENIMRHLMSDATDPFSRFGTCLYLVYLPDHAPGLHQQLSGHCCQKACTALAMYQQLEQLTVRRATSIHIRDLHVV